MILTHGSEVSSESAALKRKANIFFSSPITARRLPWEDVECWSEGEEPISRDSASFCLRTTQPEGRACVMRVLGALKLAAHFARCAWHPGDSIIGAQL